MIKTVRWTVVLAVVAAVAFSAAARAEEGKAVKEKKAPKSLMTRLDTNSDGKVSKEEYVAGFPNAKNKEGLEKKFAKLDKDSDGSLTPAELTPPAKEKKEKKAN